ncbi:MAG: LysM domain-containing protein [Pseudomonadota bacterium]
MIRSISWLCYAVAFTTFILTSGCVSSDSIKNSISDNIQQDSSEVQKADEPPAEKEKTPPPSPQTPIKNPIKYVVKENDTLSVIAKINTGDKNNWEQIALYNKITDPDTLKIGQIILIPDDLYQPQAIKKDNKNRSMVKSDNKPGQNFQSMPSSRPTQPKTDPPATDIAKQAAEPGHNLSNKEFWFDPIYPAVKIPNPGSLKDMDNISLFFENLATDIKSKPLNPAFVYLPFNNFLYNFANKKELKCCKNRSDLYIYKFDDIQNAYLIHGDKVYFYNEKFDTLSYLGEKLICVKDLNDDNKIDFIVSQVSTNPINYEIIAFTLVEDYNGKLSFFKLAEGRTDLEYGSNSIRGGIPKHYNDHFLNPLIKSDTQNNYYYDVKYNAKDSLVYIQENIQDTENSEAIKSSRFLTEKLVLTVPELGNQKTNIIYKSTKDRYQNWQIDFSKFSHFSQYHRRVQDHKSREFFNLSKETTYPNLFPIQFQYYEQAGQKIPIAIGIDPNTFALFKGTDLNNLKIITIEKQDQFHKKLNHTPLYTFFTHDLLLTLEQDKVHLYRFGLKDKPTGSAY